MMKKYVKPELFYEKYELTQHIADCAWELKLTSDETCFAIPDEDYLLGVVGNLFQSDTTNGCSLIPGSNSDFYCYTNGVSGINVFKS